ncbi:MAG TPA: alpha/beta fold hydrolase [Gemmatimonadaceae bacterium]|nr:alpha/beta fold hydrolase [Gemmatimonadaceae bacterium]
MTGAEEGWLSGHDGVRLRYTALGAGAPVLLLHGFPDLRTTWRPQLPALAAAGFRAVAVDLRGYGDSDRPRAVADYRMDVLVADVVALGHALGGRVRLVGHDWGGVIAWHAAARHPALVERLVVLNAPHPARFARELRKPAQLLRSWYAAFFQLPWLPERLIAARRGALVRAALARATRRGAFTPDELRAYGEALSSPAAARAAIAYYRAAMRGPRRAVQPDGGHPPTRVERPALLVWGMRDPALRPDLTEGLERWVPDLRIARLADAGHWVHRDAPDRVNVLLTEFLV